VNRPVRPGYGPHLLHGLRLLRARWWRPLAAWRTAGTRRGDTAIRTGLLGIAGAAAADLVHASWLVLVAAALLLAVLALRAATKEPPAKAAPGPATAATEDDDQEQPADPTPDQFLALVHRVIGTAGGVHLRTLAAALAKEHGGAWEVADVRRLCQAAGQPTRPTVRAPGAGPTVGVHREDLLPLPQPSAPAPAGPVVVAGQPATTPPTTGDATTPPSPATTTFGGLRITTTPDPANPHRHAVRVVDAVRRRRP
jgi:hypothetical protein